MPEVLEQRISKQLITQTPPRLTEEDGLEVAPPAEVGNVEVLAPDVILHAFVE